MRLDPAAFGALFSSFQHSAFRLETLPAYKVAEEDQAFADFLKGKPLPSQAMDVEWRSLMQQNISAGKTMQRVHIIPSTLTPYLRYEIEWAYCYTAALGEDIRLIVSDTPKDLIGDQGDFWLFDDRVLVEMHYGPDGSFLFGENSEDASTIKQSLALNDRLLAQAEPLQQYLSRIRTS